jgi:murein DD-endopeptidase MepM/ murein hydrolase activator NlpD
MSTRRAKLRHHFSGRLLRLEDRLAPANLAIMSAQLMDNQFPPSPQPVPILGQRLFIRADWTVTATNGTDQFAVQIAVDGVPIETGNYFTTIGTNVPYDVTLNGWYAKPGPHTVTVTLDPNNILAETDEGDNSISFMFTTGPALSPPTKFFLPIAGAQDQTWMTGLYADVDPRPGFVADYRGGPMAYDGHDGWDLMTPNYAAMDRGVAITAAAPGTVSLIGDTDGYDRWFNYGFPRPINWVVVDHGGGWQTFYTHLATNSITVKVGDAVQAGSILGLTGSSGNSVGAHLHFTPFYRGCQVETGFDLASYWQNPPSYPTDVPPAVVDFGVTNLNMFTEPVTAERLEDIGTFSPTGSDEIYFWYYPNRIITGEPVTVRWTRPNNTTFDYGFTPSETYGGAYWHNWQLFRPEWVATPGTWQVTLLIGGAPVANKSFTVVAAAGDASARVFDATNTIVADGRTTPLDLGTAPVGGSPLNYTFTIKNHGSAPLTTSGLQLPTGFVLSGSFPSTIPAYSMASFTVQMQTDVAGPQFGEIRFATNDPETPTYNFNIAGTVTGAAPAGAPVITTALPSTPFYQGGGPVLLNPNATLTDGNSANFNGGQLVAEIPSGGGADDRLGIRNQGNGPGQIGVTGGPSMTVSFGGTVIGTATGGTGATPLTVALNANATVAAVQALLRNLTYDHVGAQPQTQRRYVRLSMTDNTSLPSNRVIVDVIHAGKSAAPQVASVVINNGQAQRSRVTSVAITFAGLVSLPNNVADAFELKRQVSDTSVDLTTTVTHGATTKVVLTFLGAGSEGKSLMDGRYTLTINAAQVSNAGWLDGNNDGIGGDNFVLASAAAPNPPTNIFRLFGDADGNGTVTAGDFNAFRLVYGTSGPSIFDFNDDNTVSASDFNAFRLRYGAAV